MKIIIIQIKVVREILIMPKRTLDGVARSYKRTKVAVVQKPKKNVVSEAVKKYVRKIVDADQESKISISQFAIAGVTATDSLTSPLTYFAFPTVNQGPESCDRTGNKIRVKKAMFRYMVSRNTTTPSAAPEVCYVVVGRLRTSYDTPGLTDFTQIKYQNVTGGSLVKSGMYSLDNRTFLSPYNLDTWDIKLVKKHKIHCTGLATSSGYNNNDFEVYNEGHIDLTPYIKKDWRYMDSTNNLPENEGLYIMFFAFTIDGTAYTNAINLSAVSSVEYYDA